MKRETGRIQLAEIRDKFSELEEVVLKWMRRHEMPKIESTKYDANFRPLLEIRGERERITCTATQRLQMFEIVPRACRSLFAS